MERNNKIGMLDLMGRPAFCAAEGLVTRVNALAAAYHIAPGMQIADLLLTGTEEYAAFTGGCLHLTLSAGGQPLGASVNRVADCDVFCLEEDEDNRELRAMALAAQKLRTPLSTVMLTAQQLFPVAELRDDPAAREQAAQLNRSLLQMLRVICNMTDAGESVPAPQLQTVNITAVLSEIFEKAAALVEHTECALEYQDCPETVYGLADPDSLERAVLNILSNALKFSRPGDTIRAGLTRRGRMLYLTVENSGEPIPAGIRADVFTRYRRPCSPEEKRFGIGLGFVLTRAAAAAHGGTVLIDQPGDSGTRVTMSLAIRQNNGMVRSPVLRVDYTGGYSKWLTELSEQLPASLYTEEF